MSSPPVLHELSFYALVLVSLIGVVRVMQRPEAFATLPVMAALVWTGYVLPQAFGILYNPRWLPEQIYIDGFAQTMFMSTLCVVAVLAGWATGPERPHRGRARVVQLDPHRLFLLGAASGAVFLACFLYVASLSGGLVGHYSVHGSSALDWRGIEVIMAFLMLSFGNMAVVLLAFSFLRSPKPLTAIVFLIILAPTVADILFLNRRSDFVYLSVALAVAAFFNRGWTPSRSVVLAGLAAAVAVVFVFPVIRGTFMIGAERASGVSLQTIQNVLLADVLGGSRHKEFNNSVGIVAAYNESGDFGYGAVTWNEWVRTTVPRTFFGKEVKESLMLPGQDILQAGMDEYGWAPVPYMSNSAAARLFADFYYIGAMAFFFLAYCMKAVFLRAVRGDELSQILYTAVLLLTPHWVAIGHAKAPRDLVFVFVSIWLVGAFCRLGREPLQTHRLTASQG